MTMIDHQKIPLTGPSGTILLSDLLAGIECVDKHQDRLISALRLNSQRVEQGNLFIALPGMTTDGRNYIQQALDNAAAAVVFEKLGSSRFEIGADKSAAKTPVIGIENLKQKLGGMANRFFGRPSDNMTVIGITGTNGKTTCAFLIAQALDLLGGRCGYSGTIGRGFGDKLVPADLTTVDAISMHRQLYEFFSNGADSVCMEVSSHGLDQDRAAGVNFDIAAFTNLSQDHLDYHQSMSSYGDAKRKLFEFDSLKTAVINIDDEFGRELLQFIIRQRSPENIISYGTGAGDLQPTNLIVDDQGIEFQLKFDNAIEQIKARLLGEINISNVLCAIGCLIGMGYPLREIARVFPLIKSPPGRMEVFRNRLDQPIVVVDFAHTPDALERALKSLKPLCRGNLVVVFGCGGDRDQGKRPLMGRAAELHADRIILTDDNPRTEPAEQIVAQIKDGLTQPVSVIHDRKAAVAEAISSSNKNDLILLAGKGHEATQTIGGLATDLCDRVFVPELLEALV